MRLFGFGALLAASIVAQLGGLRVTLSAGGIATSGGDQLQLWCNSPQATLMLDNHLQSHFVGIGATWQNLLSGAYVSTPEGVVIGTSRDGSPLLTQLTLQSHESQQWALKPNIGSSYRFAVLGETRNSQNGARTFGTLSKDMARRQILFAIHLGNAASNGNASQLRVFREQLHSFPFPTYCLPGNQDVAENGRKAWKELFGTMPQVFAIGHDRFLMIDNAHGDVDKPTYQWLEDNLNRANADHARHIFVFMHQPLVDLRPGLNQGMPDTVQVRRLLKLFQAHRVHTVFAGHIPMYARETRRSVYYVTTGGGGQKLAPLAGAGAFHHYVRIDVNGDDVRTEPIPI